MSSNSTYSTIESIQSGLIRYFCMTLLFFGTFGNVLNICIFTRAKLRSVPCSWYFLASTFSSLIALYTGCLTRVLTSYDYYPHTDLSKIIYCKFRTYLTFTNLSLSVWLIIGACIDRWASSSTNVQIRSFSNVKRAKQMIILITIIIYLVNGEMLYCFNGKFQSNIGSCQSISESCELYNNIALFFTYSLFPASLMLIFGLLTIRNIRRSRQQIVPSIIPISTNRNQRKTTKQMTIMLFVQVICSVLLSLPISIKNICIVFFQYRTKSKEEQQLENFFDVLFTLITLINSSISFYIFTLTGEIFRKELKQIFRSIVMSTRKNHRNIHLQSTGRRINVF